MFRSLISHGYRRVSNVFFKDVIEKQIAITIPKKRAQFNAYEVFKVSNPWQQYIGVPRAELTVVQKIDRWLTFNHREWMRYNRLGLFLDDIINDEEPVVIEAINRLPKEVKDARERRITRAMEMNMSQKELPKSQWTKPEDDIPYLRPFILWVQYEMEEMDAQKMSREDIAIPSYRAIGPDDFDHGKVYKRRLVD